MKTKQIYCQYPDVDTTTTYKNHFEKCINYPKIEKALMSGKKGNIEKF